jgi:hypothetical protein
VPTAPVAAGSLVIGYGIAVSTGVRPLGGLVLAAGTGWCAREWARRRGTFTAAALVGVQVGGFVASHRLARRLGAWPSVLVTALAGGTIAALVGDRG